jgi:TPR repeat protein
MRWVASVIEGENHQPQRWDDSAVFITGQYTFEALETIAKEVDAALFIFNADDKSWYHENFVSSVRDNVLIEYGLFCGNLSRKKSCICYVNNPHLASDLAGITCIDLSLKNKAEEAIITWLKSVAEQVNDMDDAPTDSAINTPRFQEICNQYTEYEKQLLLAAEGGDNVARYLLGLNYFTGNIAAFEQDYEKAYKWTKLAAEGEYPPAQELLGTLYYRGCCGAVEQSFKKAFNWHKKAADHNYPLSCGQTAFMYRVGLGCKQDIAASIRYNERGVELGHTEFNTTLGQVYEHYSKDFPKAREYYKKSTDFSGAACYYLGM